MTAVRSVSRDEHQVHLGDRTYCVYTEQQSGDIRYIIERKSIRDITGGSCRDSGRPVDAAIERMVLVELESHFKRLGIRYTIE